MNDLVFILVTALTSAVFATVGSLLAHKLVVNRRRFEVRLDAYADLLAAIEELHENHGREDTERHRLACRAMNLAMARVDLLAPGDIIAITQHSEVIAQWDRGSFKRDKWLDKLTTLMREDVGIRKSEYKMTTLDEVSKRFHLSLDDDR